MSATDVTLADALGRLATTPRLLVALDFDGTLAPEVDRPMEARALPEANEAIRRLVALDQTTVALVSGRDLAALDEITEVPESVMLVGSHGIEMRVDGHETSLTEAELELRARIHREMEAGVGDAEGVWIEEKPAGFALHTRLADEATTERVLTAVDGAVGSLEGVTTRRGKNILEYAVRATGKNDGVERLREIVGATAVLFAGDDVTDEDAFRVLQDGDIGVKVGSGDTAATHRVADAAEMARVLGDLADLRDHLGHS
ncbi:trehalose-phosphatase [Frigoribacterium sp. 2-23]|uniref:trehalose-phosphatase n=1 Tax=Frigoribacterium sp. 2-23 TaxID=3415006 RepID=UPI003C6F738C